MSTPSRIAVMHGNVYKSVYCHNDGYLEYMGDLLLKHYDSSKANNLIALGDLSILDTQIGEKHEFSPYTDSNDRFEQIRVIADYSAARDAGWSTFYARDRDETDCEFQTDLTFAEFLATVESCGAEYYYIMKDEVWYTGCPASGVKLIPLATALAQLNETESA